jgi:hypothetical protein
MFYLLVFCFMFFLVNPVIAVRLFFRRETAHKLVLASPTPVCGILLQIFFWCVLPEHSEYHLQHQNSQAQQNPGSSRHAAEIIGKMSICALTFLGELWGDVALGHRKTKVIYSALRAKR